MTSPDPATPESTAVGRAPAAVGGLRASLVAMPGVVVHAARLLAGHWPVLVVVALLGEAGRGGSLWAAVELSGVNSTVGVLVLALAPLCAVSALVVMFSVLRESMPGVARADEVLVPAEGGGNPDDPRGSAPERRRRRLLQVLAGVLIPFLAVYASYGLLQADTASFVNSATYDEVYSNVDALTGVQDYDVDRTALVTGWASLVVVAVALGLRQLLARWGAVRRRPPLALAAAYLEVLWLVTIARLLATYQEDVRSWIGERRATVAAAQGYERALDALGPVAGPVDSALARLAGAVGSADAVVVVPLAWLAVGAVVYGHTLAAPTPRTPRPRPRLERVTGRVPEPVRRWSAEPFAPVTDRFRGFTGGLRQMAVAGLGPMLVFALAFLVAGRLQNLLELLCRTLLGPRTLDTVTAFSPWTTMLSRGLSTVVLVCLVAAAVDRLLGAGTVSAEPAPPGSPAEPTTAAPR